MESWRQALRHSVLPGAAASVLSTIVLGVRGRRESGTPYAPTNAISHWLWGQRATQEDAPTVRYTVPGYLIHHASAMFWAALFEKWFGQRLRGARAAPVLGTAAGMAALACLVDYQLTPPRLRPGFEQRLSRPSLLMVYGAFALGLALPHLLRGGRERERA